MHRPPKWNYWYQNHDSKSIFLVFMDFSKMLTLTLTLTHFRFGLNSEWFISDTLANYLLIASGLIILTIKLWIGLNFEKNMGKPLYLPNNPKRLLRSALRALRARPFLGIIVFWQILRTLAWVFFLLKHSYTGEKQENKNVWHLSTIIKNT